MSKLGVLFLTLAAFGLMTASVPSSAQTSELLTGVDVGALYLVSLDNGRSAGAVSASVPVVKFNDILGVRSVTFNVDALGVATKNTTTLTAGGSVTVEGLNNTAFQVGLAYIPADNMKFSAYFKVIGVRF
jgi:hypothetical protein